LTTFDSGSHFERAGSIQGEKTMKCSVDFLPSGNVQMSLDAEVSTAIGLKIFEILAGDDAKGQALLKKTSAKQMSKTRAA
jgi:hypothetical protein